MNVLTVFAHPNPSSFCGSVLEHFSRGLDEAGHTNDVVDLYAIDFDPVLRAHDWPNWLDESIPEDQLERMNLAEQIADSASGPLQRWMVRFRLRNRDPREIVELIQRHRPRDVAIQQEKVAAADVLAFISPVYFMGFPAILKGWIERVFSLGFAFGMTPEGWHGDLAGRIPLLDHEKAIIINTTLFDEQAYQSGLGDAMKRLIDDFAFRYPGIKDVEHVYFYAVGSVDDDTRQEYLQRAYLLGRELAPEHAAATPAATPRELQSRV
jgi:NAD(P)H dehydrogenase (quinone)